MQAGRGEEEGNEQSLRGTAHAGHDVVAQAVGQPERELGNVDKPLQKGDDPGKQLCRDDPGQHHEAGNLPSRTSMPATLWS